VSWYIWLQTRDIFSVNSLYGVDIHWEKRFHIRNCSQSSYSHEGKSNVCVKHRSAWKNYSEKMFRNYLVVKTSLVMGSEEHKSRFLSVTKFTLLWQLKLINVAKLANILHLLVYNKIIFFKQSWVFYVMENDCQLVMGPGQKFLTRDGSAIYDWVWIWKISPKNVKFFKIFLFRSKKISSGRVKKYPGKRGVGLLFTAGQK